MRVARVVSRCKCHNFGWRTVERGGRDYRFIDLIFPRLVPAIVESRCHVCPAIGRTNEGTAVSRGGVVLESVLLKGARIDVPDVEFPRKEHALPPCFKRSNGWSFLRNEGWSTGERDGGRTTGYKKVLGRVERNERTYWELGWSKIYGEKLARGWKGKFCPFDSLIEYFCSYFDGRRSGEEGILSMEK